MVSRLRGLLAFAALATAGAAGAEAEHFELDPVHTRLAFRIDHAGLSSAIGTFAGARGTLRFDPDDWTTATLEVHLPLASLEIGDAAWRDKVLDRTFLDAGGSPEARFVSTRVEPGAAGEARVHGELSLRGVTRPLVLDVKLNALKRHPLTFRRTAGFSARGRLSRRDFGIDAWPNVVGDEVELMIEAEAIKRREGKPAGENDDADPQ